MSNSADIQARVEATRGDLARTLDEIEDKFNVPKQVGELTRKAKASYEENPIPWIVAAASVAVAVVGLIAWALMSGDD